MNAPRIVLELDVALDTPPTKLKRAILAAYIEAALVAHDWNRAKTARAMRTPRANLRRMIRELAIAAPSPGRTESHRHGNLVRWRYASPARPPWTVGYSDTGGYGLALKEARAVIREATEPVEGEAT